MCCKNAYIYIDISQLHENYINMNTFYYLFLIKFFDVRDSRHGNGLNVCFCSVQTDRRHAHGHVSYNPGSLIICIDESDRESVGVHFFVCGWVFFFFFFLQWEMNNIDSVLAFTSVITPAIGEMFPPPPPP